MADEWRGRHVAVGGAGVSGAAVVAALLARGAQVTVIDQRQSPGLPALEAVGAAILVDPKAFPGRVTDFVVSPGWRPDSPLIQQALASGVAVYSEPEFAWRIRGHGAAPWLAVTGTNGKTTTVTMLAAILAAAGRRTIACGNIGHPLTSAVTAPDGFDVLAVELSSFQLHYSHQLAPEFAALLNLADDHLDWHGSFDAYVKAKAAMWRAPTGIAVGNVDDGAVAEALMQAPGRSVGVTLRRPGVGQLGVVDGVLVDNAFGSDRELLPTADVIPPGDHNVVNALTAAALALAYGVAPDAVAAGLRGYQPQPHRNAFVAEVAQVRYVDDSKATNPHAALASLSAYDRVVWVAGGQLKGVDVDELVRTVAPRLAGAVLIGVDRAELAAALQRHAPDVAVAVVDVSDNGPAAMAAAVSAAAAAAHPGDTVLLAPAAASLDMFDSYSQRGEVFATAVRAYAEQH